MPVARVVVARLAVVVFVVLAACSRASGSTAGPVSYPAIARIRSGSTEVELHVAIARTDAEKQRGLMNVRSLPTDDGMAFVWDSPVQTTFWMKDTLIPLSIAFVDADGRIVTIRDMSPCTADPCPDYGSRAPYVTAIEVNRGWFGDHGVAVGDRVTLGGGA